MTSPTDEEWELLNALHDGELPSDQAKAMRKRIEGDADLTRAFESISVMSTSLRALRPATCDEEPVSFSSAKAANNNNAAYGWLSGGLVAAMVLVAAVVWLGHFTHETPLDVHKRFAQQGFVFDTAPFEHASTFGTFDVPDLSPAQLKPVALSDFSDATVAHYTGRNGCRLSYFRGPTMLDMPEAGHGQSAAWVTDDGYYHQIIATGMDTAKFAAIANFLQFTTRKNLETQAYTALTSATEKAIPCLT